MPTNLAIDGNLLTKAQRIGKHKTKKDTVNQALREFIQRREQRNVLALFNTIVYEPDSDDGSGKRRD